MKRSSLSLWRNNHKRRREKGVILFLAVAAIAVLSILALGASSSVQQELNFLKFLTEANASFYYASSSAQLMTIVLKNDATPLAITLYDLRPRQLKVDDKTIDITLSDEESRVNIKTAPKEVLLRLPGLTANEALVNVVKASALAVKEDLLFIEGVTDDIYAQLKEEVTLYGSGRVNINTASLGVLSALGMERNLIDKIQNFRVGEDAEPGTADDGCFCAPDRIVSSLEPAGLAKNEKELLETLIAAGSLGVASNTIDMTITVKKINPVRDKTPEASDSSSGESVSNGVKALRIFRIVLDLPTGAILSWHEE